MPENVVIGGGVYGTGVAWELAGQGREVRLLENRTVASSASGGPGRRGVRANGRDCRELPLMKIAYEVWPVLHEQLNSREFYQRTGGLLLMERAEDLDKASARVWLQHQHGIDSRLVAQDELRELEPALDPGIKSGICCARDGTCDHSGLVHALTDRSRQLGAMISEQTHVASLHIAGDRVSSVTTDTGEVIPVKDHLFVLCNSGAADLLDDIPGLQLPVWNACLQVLITEPISGLIPTRLVGHAHRTVSLKALSGDRVMISGGWYGRWDSTHNVGEVVDTSVQGNVAEAVSVCPALENVGVAVADAGHLEAMCIDDIPIIDRIPGTTNAFFATGWSGHGWAIAPVVTRLLVDWAVSGQRPVLLAPFGLNRFKPGEL